MFPSHQRSICNVVLLALVLCCGILGCANDRPFSQWENPFQTVDTSYKESYGLTPNDVANEIRALADKVGDLSAEDQQKVSLELTTRYESEKDPNLRRELIYALGSFPDPFAAPGLHAALSDTDRFVRAEAVRAWSRRSSEEAMQTLAATIQTEESIDVRQVAIRGIKRFQHPDAIRTLGDVLNERDPAMQYLAMQSLKSASGKDLGNDTRKWDEYIASTYPYPGIDTNGMPHQGSMIAEAPETDTWR